MWMLPCVFCVLTFPEPTPADRVAIQMLIPGPLPVDSADRPWSEVTGPYSAGRIVLLTPEFGIVRVAQTWRAGSITMQQRGGTIRVIRKRSGAWQLDAIIKE